MSTRTCRSTFRAPLTPATFLLALILHICSACADSSPPAPPLTHREHVTINQSSFALELAIDPLSRDKGLMNRPQIPAGTGMLFVFPKPALQYFWMGYCLTDMDIVFLDAAGRVTATHEMKALPPRRPDESEDAYRRRLGTYSSGSPAVFAIELPPGSIKSLKVRVEDHISLDLDRLKALAR